MLVDSFWRVLLCVRVFLVTNLAELFEVSGVCVCACMCEIVRSRVYRHMCMRFCVSLSVLVRMCLVLCNYLSCRRDLATWREII